MVRSPILCCRKELRETDALCLIAGISLKEISGTQTSVFCGCFSNDYRDTTVKDLEHYPKYASTGTGQALLSNRVSYFYNLHGPSVTLDTACSSSLIGFHMAHQSIRNGEADVAIAIGSALHYDPTMFLWMTDMNFLSPDGRCRAFDALGRGYVRGEGICAVVLKRKDLAELDGNKIRAAVCGTGTNHDGYKEGLTMPNSEAQESLIANVYKNAGVPTNETAYFEAHGTGTPAGDPREMRAIGAVFAPKRTQPLYVGSVKTNIGHLEGASGLAGIIKTTLSLEAGKILPNMHFRNPNPHIHFENWKVTVPTKVIDWTPINGVRRASINSFGYGGANAHVILQAVEASDEASLEPDLSGFAEQRPFLLPLTSHTEKAGAILKRDLGHFIEASTNSSLASIGRSLSDKGRSMHKYRSYAVANDQENLLEQLSSPAVAWTQASDSKLKIGFIFTGQGAQWFAMGRQLIELNCFFRQTLEKCDQVLQRLPNRPGWSCIDELLKPRNQSRINEFALSSPLCCIIQVAIVDLLKQWGIEPVATVGHSSGEIPAAYAAGILSFEDTLICAYQRGYVLGLEVENRCISKGAMIAVGISEDEAELELEPFKGQACIAAVNSYSSLTISGDEPVIVKIKESLEERKIFVRQLQVERAFHSHHMVPYAPTLARLTRDIKPQKANCRMVSSVTGDVVEGPEVTGTYFAENLTGKVRFADALTEMLLNDSGEQAVDILLEIGAHPALKGPSRHSLQSLKLDIPYIATLDRALPAFESMLVCAGNFFAHGYPIDLLAVNSNLSINYDGSIVKTLAGRKVPLPSYSWNHGKYWSESRIAKNLRLRKHRHSILGIQTADSTEKNPRWRRLLRQSELPWSSDHRIEGNVIFPAAGYFSMAIEAALRHESCPLDIKAISFRDVTIKAALALSERESGTEVLLDLQPALTSAKRTSELQYRFSINSCNEIGICFEHCQGLIEIQQGLSETIQGNLPSISHMRKRTNRSQSVPKYYRHLASIGLQYGEAFKLIEGQIESGNGVAIAPLRLQQNDDCVLHPTFLDAALHPLFAGLETVLGKSLNEPFVPTFMKSMEVSGAFIALMKACEEQHTWVCSQTSLPGPRVAVNDISVRSEDCDQNLIDIRGLEATALGNSLNDNAQKRSLFFRTKWQPAFDCLSGSQRQLVSDIAGLMDLYAHQFPNSKILYYANKNQAVRDVLRPLGGKGGKCRRIQSLTPYTVGAVNDWTEIKNEWPELISLSEPEAGAYDAIVLGEQPTEDIIKFLKPCGFIIADGIGYKSQSLSKVFEIAGMSAWRDQPDSDFSDEPLTLITSTNASSETENLISNITEGHTEEVSRLALADITSQTLLSQNVIVLCSLDEDQCFGITDREESKAFAALKVVFENTTRNIMWLTKGASMECSSPEQAIITGLTRTARNENEKLKIVVMDIPQTADAEEITMYIGQVLSNPLTEEEFAARDDILYIPRVEADDELNAKLPINSEGKIISQSVGSSKPLALQIGKVGLLETLAFSEDSTITETDLQRDEVEIAVKASALNCRDVAASVGTVDDFKLGDDCAGVVIRTGSESTDFKVGDHVVAWRPGQGAHRTVVRNPASLCFKIGTMPFSTAASLPLITTTAYYGLVMLARIEPGEHVLIHAAAGCVGQMAIQLAQMFEANVIVTCGSESKRELLRNTYGLKDSHILSSRDSSFVDGVLKLTNSKGVDVVLNSLEGDLLHATWKCIARFGRFIQIGKRDIQENGKLDMDQFRKNISFSSIDLTTVFEHNQSLGARLLKASMKLVEEKKIQPPTSIMELSYAEAERGFRLLQSGGHIGKIVLVPHNEDVVPVSLPTFSSANLFDSQKTYLIVGGLGGLCRILAEFMIRRGARSLAVMSRSGTSSASTRASIAWLEARDIQVRVFSADVTDYSSVSKCIESIGPRLGGIFHAAMVLQDCPLSKMTYQQWQTSLRPKVLGAQNLHRATSHLDLEFFIPLSSVSAIVGSLAQANYAAANCYLDALVRHRRERGLTASTMNIGMIRSAGIVEGNEELERKMIALGYDAISEDEFLYQVQEAIKVGKVPPVDSRGICQYQVITGINTAKKDLYWSTNSSFRNLYANLDLDGAGKDAQKSGSLSSILRNTSDISERTTALTAAFLDKLSAVLGTAKELISPSNPLSTYGLDSIVAVELRKWFSNTVQVDLALFDILSTKSIESLVAKAAAMVLIDTGDATSPKEAVKVEEMSKATAKKILGASPVMPRSEDIERHRTQIWSEVKRANTTVSVLELSF